MKQNVGGSSPSRSASFKIGSWCNGSMIFSKNIRGGSSPSEPAIYLKPLFRGTLLEKDTTMRELDEEEKNLAKDLKAFLIRNKIKLVRWKSHGHVYFTNDEKGLCVNLEALADEIGVKEI